MHVFKRKEWWLEYSVDGHTRKLFVLADTREAAQAKAQAKATALGMTTWTLGHKRVISHNRQWITALLHIGSANYVSHLTAQRADCRL